MPTAVTPFKTRHPFNAAPRKLMVALLNQSLSDLSDLYSQVKQAHWNIKGDNFIALHKLFDEIAETLQEPIDTVAERIVTLGGVAEGTVRQTAAKTDIKELSREFDQHEVLGELADRFAAFSKAGYAAVDKADEAKDPVTADIYTQITRSIDKSLYFLETHLQTRTLAP